MGTSNLLLDAEEAPYDIERDCNLLDLHYVRGRLDADTIMDDDTKKYYWKAYKTLYIHIETLENQSNNDYAIITTGQTKLAEAYNDVDMIIDMLSEKVKIMNKLIDELPPGSLVELNQSFKRDISRIARLGYSMPENLKPYLDMEISND